MAKVGLCLRILMVLVVCCGSYTSGHDLRYKHIRTKMYQEYDKLKVESKDDPKYSDSKYLDTDNVKSKFHESKPGSVEHLEPKRQDSKFSELKYADSRYVDLVHARSKTLLDSNFANSKTARLILEYQDSLEESWKWRKTECNTFQSSDLVDCLLCAAVIEEGRTMLAKGVVQKEITDFIVFVCIKSRLEDENVCTGMVHELKTVIFDVLLRVATHPSQLCGSILGQDCGAPRNPDVTWNVTFPRTPKPRVQPPQLPKPNKPRVRVLQLTDIHIDREYVAGSNANCHEPLCCRARNGPPEPGHPGAGTFGDYRHCDMPHSFLDNLFQLLASNQHKFDYVMFTGDIPPHNVWNQSRDDQLIALKDYTHYMLKYLPNKKIYNTLGNHEGVPVNCVPPPYITGEDSAQWLNDALHDSWIHWLPQNTEPTIRKAAFYAHSPFKGLKIVSLNMNMCLSTNFWIYVNTTDPGDMLQWFIAELQDSEDKGQKVHVIGHVYPGCSCCLREWSWNYYKIINRYESTITGQFFGHTHEMQYEMFYDLEDMTRPVGVAYMPGSVTTYKFLNPGFRIYEMDGDYEGSSWQILDFTNYYVNITKANERGEIEWEEEYSAKEAYNLKSLAPEQWNNLIYRMKHDDTLFHYFCKHTKKSAPNICRHCSGACKRSLLCSLKSGRSGDNHICDDL